MGAFVQIFPEILHRVGSGDEHYSRAVAGSSGFQRMFAVAYQCIRRRVILSDSTIKVHPASRWCLPANRLSVLALPAHSPKIPVVANLLWWHCGAVEGELSAGVVFNRDSTTSARPVLAAPGDRKEDGEGSRPFTGRTAKQLPTTSRGHVEHVPGFLFLSQWDRNKHITHCVTNYFITYLSTFILSC
jgi:hypothetical protein